MQATIPSYVQALIRIIPGALQYHNSIYISLQELRRHSTWHYCLQGLQNQTESISTTKPLPSGGVSYVKNIELLLILHIIN